MQYCTGFMALVSNPRTVRLMAAWKERLEHGRLKRNQPVFNAVLHTVSAQYGLDWLELPQPAFPNGAQWFEQWGSAQRAGAAVVHNNFIVGHDAKRRRFQDHSLWRVARTATVGDRDGDSDGDGGRHRSGHQPQQSATPDSTAERK